MKLRQKKELLKQLETLPDFRKHDGKIVYPLAQVLFMPILAMLKEKQIFSFDALMTQCRYS